MKQWFRVVLLTFGAVGFPASLIAQADAIIAGTITSDFGAPLAGAYVTIEELGTATFTREDGRYSFAIPAGRVQGQEVTVRVRLLGYKPRSARFILASGTTTQDFALQANPLQLGEVVITGAGTEREAQKIAYARNPVDSGLLARSNEVNVVAALAGKAPNVEVSSQSGEPGASAFLRIRGPKTIQGTGQPLIVVDGVAIDNSTNSTGSFLASTVTPNRASDLNAADIESIEILKGAAASAMYGARAGQGVVLITTKSGRPGATQYSWRTTLSFDKVNQTVGLQRRYGQGSFNVAASCSAPGCRPSPTSYGPELAPSAVTYDQFGTLFEGGFGADNVLTISGGSDRTQFYFSGGYYDSEGMIVGPNDAYQRSTIRLKASHRLTDVLRVGGNIAYADVRGNFIQKGSNISGLLLGGLRTPPEFDNSRYLDSATGLHRSYRYPRPTATSALASRGYDNPFFVAYEHANQANVGRVFGNINVEYLPLSWLKLDYTLGGDYSGDERLSGFPQSASDFAEGRVIRADFITYQIDHGLTATASRQLSRDVAARFTLGQNLSIRNFRQVYVVGNKLIAPDPFKLSNTVDRDPPSDFESEVHLEGYFGQATFDLYDQLFLEVALRNDGSSTFGRAKRRHWFPKANAAWTFTSALRPSDFLNFGKLRVAYGQSGQQPGAYQTVQIFSTGAFGDGGWGPTVTPTQGGFGGLYSGSVQGQDSLKPERTSEIEAGVDLAFWRERADLGITYYSATSRDVIFNTPLPPSTGFTSQVRNAATITNRGWELTLNFRPVVRPNLRWEFGLQWGTNDNRVQELVGAEFVLLGGAFAGAPGAAVEGSRVGVLRGFDFARCGRSLVIGGVDIDAACGGASAGALYIAPSGFPVQDPTARVIMDPHPDWTGSLQSALQFGKWRVSGLLDIKRGGQMWNGTRGALYNFGTHIDTEQRATCTIVAGVVTCTGNERVFGTDILPGPVAGPGAGTAVPIGENWYTGLGGGFGPVASQFIEEAGFVKLRELSVSYTWDSEWLQRALGFRSIDLRVAGRNLITWTDYTGIDPETNLAGAEVGLRGVDYFNHPQTRSFVFTVGLNR